MAGLMTAILAGHGLFANLAGHARAKTLKAIQEAHGQGKFAL
jgi:hypothetical protein